MCQACRSNTSLVALAKVRVAFCVRLVGGVGTRQQHLIGVDIERNLHMAKELEVLWRKLSFTEEEGEGVELGSSSTKAANEVGKNCAIVKIMTHRSISLDTLRKNLRMLWKTNKWVNFSELEADLFLVEFRDGKIRRKL